MRERFRFLLCGAQVVIIAVIGSYFIFNSPLESGIDALGADLNKLNAALEFESQRRFAGEVALRFEAASHTAQGFLKWQAVFILGMIFWGLYKVVGVTKELRMPPPFESETTISGSQRPPSVGLGEGGQAKSRFRLAGVRLLLIGNLLCCLISGHFFVATFIGISFRDFYIRDVESLRKLEGKGGNSDFNEMANQINSHSRAMKSAVRDMRIYFFIVVCLWVFVGLYELYLELRILKKVVRPP